MALATPQPLLSTTSPFTPMCALDKSSTMESLLSSQCYKSHSILAQLQPKVNPKTGLNHNPTITTTTTTNFSKA